MILSDTNIDLKKPKVSIIVPVHNCEKYINRTLDALKNQTLKNIEIIVVDDCSTDKTLSVLNEFATNDSRFKIITFSKNSGPGAARNAGLENAKGEYIGFCDSDDYVDLNFYEELYNKAIADDVDIVKGVMRTVDFSGDIVIGDINSKIERNKLEFSYEFVSAIYKLNFLLANNIKFPVKYRTSEDFVFLMNCLLKIKKISLNNNVYYNYIRRKKSLDKEQISFCGTLLSLNIINEIMKTVESSQLKTTNKNDYTKIIEIIIRRHFYFLKQCSSFLAKYICMKSLVKTYFRCENPEILEKYYKFKWMLPYIKRKRIFKLTLKYNPDSPNCPL